MRVIDAEALKEKVKEGCKRCIHEWNSRCEVCSINAFLRTIDNAPTVNGIISSEDFKKRINNMEYIYLQSCAEDIIDAIDCEVTYFKEKMTKGPNSES